MSVEDAHLIFRPGAVLEIVHDNTYEVGDLIHVTHTNLLDNSMHGVLLRDGKEVSTFAPFKDSKLPGWNLRYFISAVTQGAVVVHAQSVADKIDAIVAAALGE